MASAQKSGFQHAVVRQHNFRWSQRHVAYTYTQSSSILEKGNCFLALFKRGRRAVGEIGAAWWHKDRTHYTSDGASQVLRCQNPGSLRTYALSPFFKKQGAPGSQLVALHVLMLSMLFISGRRHARRRCKAPPSSSSARRDQSAHDADHRSISLEVPIEVLRRLANGRFGGIRRNRVGKQLRKPSAMAKMFPHQSGKLRLRIHATNWT
ncbi:hypothetical protein B0H11DRAFT_1928500 [Mycena galericulata]|nr:hypothetical protein B0H11DRAFT_1928500 [Mycena galericulata]